jgi:hypothetical protein
VTRVALVIALVVLVMGGVLAVRGMGKSSPVDDSISKLNDNKRFATSARAGQTVADIATTLRLEGARCRKRDAKESRCTVLLQAAAYSAVTAYTLVDCTAPGVYDGRKAMLGYLQRVKKFMHDGAPAPTVPKVITC